MQCSSGTSYVQDEGAGIAATIGISELPQNSSANGKRNREGQKFEEAAREKIQASYLASHGPS